MPYVAQVTTDRRGEMNINTQSKDYTAVNGGLSKLGKADADRKGYKYTTKAEKARRKANRNSDEKK